MKTKLPGWIGNTLVCAVLVVFLGINETHASIVSFNYDPAGRLITSTFAGNKSINYTYNHAGSLLQRAMNVGVNPDSDNDGMDDAWEILHFGSKEARDGTLDFDGDGASDLAEFISGTLPKIAASVFKIIRIYPEANVTIEWASIADKRYQVQSRDSVTSGNWYNVSDEIIASGATTSVQDTNNIGPSPRYYRVRLVTSSLLPPSLFAYRSGNQLFLSWPSSGTAGFTLESATSLTPVIVWDSVTNSVSDNGVLKSVTFDQISTTPQRLFRLRQ